MMGALGALVGTMLTSAVALIVIGLHVRRCADALERIADTEESWSDE